MEETAAERQRSLPHQIKAIFLQSFSFNRDFCQKRDFSGSRFLLCSPSVETEATKSDAIILDYLSTEQRSEAPQRLAAAAASLLDCHRGMVIVY